MKRRTILSVVLALLVVLSVGSVGHAKILVISPHPDDDTLITSGIISSAVSRVEPVEVVYITNGDNSGGTTTGIIRQGEAVIGEGYLGMIETNLIFLGYPDGYLQTIYNSYPLQLDTFITPLGQSVTYGNHGLGGTDYHNYKFLSHANYNKYNIVADLQDIINTFRPDHIFVTAQFDQNPDHATTYHLMHDALQAVTALAPTYNPTVHKTCVHCGSDVWPNALDATAYFTEIPNFADISGLNWADRESITVPPSMQSTNNAMNNKFLAILAQRSQSYDDLFLMSFVHKDEIFWTEDYAGNNPAPAPIANAGTDLTRGEGVLVGLDGSLSYAPNGHTALTYSWTQIGGPTVTLSNSTSVNPTLTTPSGLSRNTVLTFTLVVSDGLLKSIPTSVNVNVTATNPSSRANIAPAANVSASSESTATGQTATKAVDGFIDGFGGYPGITTHEWATNGEVAGAWLELDWAAQYIVDQIILYDRPNANDQITGATIHFSDGTSQSVGTLDNLGGAYIIAISPAKDITSLRLTVDSVSGTTQAVGLAEIEVYGVVTGTTFAVTPSTGAGGSFTNPGIVQRVSSGGTATFTVTPNPGYHMVAPISGTCPAGTLSGTSYTTGPITANCTVVANFAINTYNVTPSAGTGGSISPNVVQIVNYNATQAFTVTPNAGYHVASIGGTCPAGTLSGTSYTTGPITADCTVVANFALPTYNVTPSAGAGGTISPNVVQTVSSGTTQAFTVTPNAGYHITSIGGTCPVGTLSGTSYTTGPITADCTVVANFAVAATFNVTPSAGVGGTISPNTTQTVSNGATQAFTVTPNAGYHITSIGGTCPVGTLSGTSYTTGPITADCTVVANFALPTYNVTPSAGAGGTISPNTTQTVNQNATTSFTVTPNTGYHIASVTGCGGTLSGTTYTTGPITAACSVTASFAAITDKIGVFRPSGGIWFLDYPGYGQWVGCGTTPTTDRCYTGFGIEGDIPVVGDWNGDGTTKVGAFRAGTWYLDYPGTGVWVGCGTTATTDRCYTGFGIAGDIPVVGDWNGDGRSKLGAFRAGIWYLDYPGYGQWVGCGTTPTTDRCYTGFGIAGDIPVVGDWNGDGRTKLGAFRAGTWFLDYPGTGTWVGCGTTPTTDRCFTGFGIAGDIPVVGDWNGDGRTKIGAYRNGTWYLDYPGTGVWVGCGGPIDPTKDACYVGAFGAPGDIPVVGAW